MGSSKGKLEIDESIENCVTREVIEECGIDGLQIQNKISVTYHTYIQNNEKILKENSLVFDDITIKK